MAEADGDLKVLTKGQAVQLELEPDGGEVKSMSSQKLATYTNTDMVINVYCEHEVHGFLDSSQKQPASLLVLQFQLGGKSTSRRFKAFKPRITFHAEPRSSRARDEPWVTDCVYPGVATTSFYEVSSEVVENLSKSLSLGLKGPDIAPADLALAFSKAYQETWTKQYRYTVQAVLSEEKPGMRSKDDRILWKAWQPDKVDVGIDVLQVAMVILRKDGYDLNLTIEFDADVDFWYKVKQEWDRYFGWKGRKRNCKLEVYEDVKDNNGSSVKRLRTTEVPKGIDPNNLGLLESTSRHIFQALGWVHTVEAQQPKKYYVGKDDDGQSQSST